MKKDWVTIVIATVVSLVLCFIVTDCSFGRTKVWETTVFAKEYKPPWTERETKVDEDGGVIVSETRHPEEYHVFCSEMGGERTFNVITDATTYHLFTNGQYATVKTREGRFSKVQWMPTIKP